MFSWFTGKIKRTVFTNICCLHWKVREDQIHFHLLGSCWVGSLCGTGHIHIVVTHTLLCRNACQTVHLELDHSGWKDSHAKSECGQPYLSCPTCLSAPTSPRLHLKLGHLLYSVLPFSPHAAAALKASSTGSNLGFNFCQGNKWKIFV